MNAMRTREHSATRGKPTRRAFFLASALIFATAWLGNPWPEAGADQNPPFDLATVPVDGIYGIRTMLVVMDQPIDLATVPGVQRALITLGYDPGPVDGIYGIRTMLAVMAFQRDHGLLADGIAGVQTCAALRNALNAIGVPHVN